MSQRKPITPKQKAFLDSPPEGRAVMEFRPKIIVTRIAVSVEMDHAQRALLGDGAEYWQRYRVIAAGRKRYHARAVHGFEESLNFLVRRF